MCMVSREIREMVLSGTFLAQTARITMAAFQIGALSTKAVVKPLYTKKIWALMSHSTISKLGAVGMSNLIMFEAIRDCRLKPTLSNLANALTMFGTGAIYVMFPVKGLAINIPFVASLFSAGVVNIFNILNRRTPVALTHTKEENHGLPITALAMILTGASSLLFLSKRMSFSSENHRSIISKVYLSQLVMNTVTAGIMELQTPTRKEMSRKHLYLALLGFCCSRANMTVTAAISTGGVALAAVRALC
ncbi:unnamed protein product [Agarophyton chilense]